jgi:hypothetical protein
VCCCLSLSAWSRSVGQAGRVRRSGPIGWSQLYTVHNNTEPCRSICSTGGRCSTRSSRVLPSFLPVCCCTTNGVLPRTGRSQRLHRACVRACVQRRMILTTYCRPFVICTTHVCGVYYAMNLAFSTKIRPTLFCLHALTVTVDLEHFCSLSWSRNEEFDLCLQTTLCMY